MENLQRQQAARLALEEEVQQDQQLDQQDQHQDQQNQHLDLRSTVESQIQQQALAFRHYQAAVRSALSAGVLVPRRGDGYSSPDCSEEERGDDPRDSGEREVVDGEEVVLHRFQQRQCALTAAGASPQSPPAGRVLARVPGASVPGAPVPGALVPTPRLHSPSAQPQSQHQWTYEEQFKQLYELDDDEKRKEFLDDLFSFMQKRGTPVNRIPIMAKQVLDLYMLYKLVTEKGGLVEVINKKIWREITKGLNLPTSITSAAFTLRTQYMKYLYPYECEKRGLSSPGELQAAIDSNRREGRRLSYGSVIFNYSPVATPTLLPSPKMPSHFPVLYRNSGHTSQKSEVKTEEPMAACLLPGNAGLSVSPGSQNAAATLQLLRDKLQASEPPQKKRMMGQEEQQSMVEDALQENLLTMASQLPLNIKLNNRDDRQEAALNLSTDGISSINMSIEINGVVYTGVLFARQLAMAGMVGPAGKHSSWKSKGKSTSTAFQPSTSTSSCSSFSLHGHRNTSS
ncbi:AT-rich interactive domain-containing protein 3A [Cololabis saira]|uniref:AT-rich interactive domain-containing protein 3A n=1 Tax=Cololabis saira TaxID=129043 RepID=UPI002AD2C37D|nr:AT-rich interactive domain-containing protein 3A [Cololabis saira]